MIGSKNFKCAVIHKNTFLKVLYSVLINGFKLAGN